MGVYFIAAGKSSKNREKTLEKSWNLEDICRFISNEDCDRLRRLFPSGRGIYIWGANKGSYSEVEKIKEGEYVVDVKNKEVVQIFQYCFLLKTEDTKLQEYLEWDSEKPYGERRQYKYVYFLRNPIVTTNNKKEYFQEALGLWANSNWLVGQKYFSDKEVSDAIIKTGSKSVEGFLGIGNTSKILNMKDGEYTIPQDTETTNKNTQQIILGESREDSEVEIPDWVKKIIEEVFILKNDAGHYERDHEDLVANFFKMLGYAQFKDIKFRRGNIDIRIDKNNKPMIVIEVKSDWALSMQNKGAREQAFRYALDAGARYVIVTNGDYYCLYDRKKGLSYEEQFLGDFQLSNLSEEGLQLIEMLKKSNLE